MASVFFGDVERHDPPCDHRLLGLHRTAGPILGLDPAEVPLRLQLPDGDTRLIAEKYVVIATKASTQARMWSPRDGWREIIKRLKAHGDRVMCIDRESAYGWQHGLKPGPAFICIIVYNMYTFD